MRWLSGIKRWGRCRFPIAVFVLMNFATGCSIVPGLYLGVKETTTISESETSYVYDVPDVNDITTRADIFAITPATVMAQEESPESEKINVGDLAESGSVEQYAYRVGKQDVLLVTVWNHPELNNPAGMTNLLAGRPVGPDGTFFYPYAGNVKAEGRTVKEIRDDIRARLAQVLVEPQVDVSVLSYRSQRVYVLGQVEKPGVVPLTDVPLTVTDVLSQVGGVTPEADLSGVTLLRDGNQIPIDLYALYYKGDVKQNRVLRAGDVLTVPENRYNKIFVLGEVGKQQSIVMPRGRMSLAESISDAGGFNPFTANTGQVYVIRAGKNNRVQIWHLNAASPDALVLADKFTLKPRDIVYVDPAGVARFGRVINNILPTVRVINQVAQ